MDRPDHDQVIELRVRQGLDDFDVLERRLDAAGLFGATSRYWSGVMAPEVVSIVVLESVVGVSTICKPPSLAASHGL